MLGFGRGGSSPLALLHWRIKRWPGWAWCCLPGLAGLWDAKGNWGVSTLLPMGMWEVDSQREPSSPDRSGGGVSKFHHCLLCPPLAPCEQSWPPPLQMECLLSAAVNVTRSPQLTSPPFFFFFLKIPHPPSLLPVLCRARLLSLAAAGCGSCITSLITSSVLLQTPGSREEFLRAGCYASSCSVFWGSSSRIPCMCPRIRVCI